MNQKLFKILLYTFMFSGIANANENKQNIELVTKKFTNHLIHEVAPEITIPEYLKKYKLPDGISFSGFDEMHYDNNGNTYTIDPFNPIDKIEYNFGEDKNKSITYDSNGQVYFQFKKSFNWK